ncbi:MAG: helix-turn-helix transcriptional regulator [Elusimicrobiota bacterium]
MKAARSFRERLKKDLKNPDFKKAFDEEEIYSSVAIQIAKLREQEHLTQSELSKKLHTTQQTISRLEDINNDGYSLKTLVKIAQTFHRKLKIEFVR